MSVLTKYTPSCPLTPQNIDDIKTRFQDALGSRVDAAYLFGSVATGSFRIDSDVDLILIKETSELFARRGLEFLDLFEIHPALDLLVYTKAEFDRQLAPPLGGFWKSVKQTMRRLI